MARHGPQPPTPWTTATQGTGEGARLTAGDREPGREGPERGVPVTPDSHEEVSPGTCGHTHNPGPRRGPGRDPGQDAPGAFKPPHAFPGWGPFRAEGRPRVPPTGEVEAAAGVESEPAGWWQQPALGPTAPRPTPVRAQEAGGPPTRPRPRRQRGGEGPDAQRRRHREPVQTALPGPALSLHSFHRCPGARGPGCPAPALSNCVSLRS